MTLKEFFDRYGLTVSIIVVFALVVALLPGNKPSSSSVNAESRSATQNTTNLDGATGDTALDGAASGTSDTLVGGAINPARSTGSAGSSGGGGAVASAPGQVNFGKGKDCNAKAQQIGFSP